jgi:hypothetical protein
MFNVTLINLTADARTTTEGGGPLDLGLVPVAELLALLDAFAELDAVENMKADPEIRIQTRKDRFIVRTGQRKLFLYDARRLSEPAYVLSSGEILAELDGTAAARRTAPPIPFTAVRDAESAVAGFPEPGDLSGNSPPPPAAASRRGTAVLLGVALLLGGYIAYSEFAAAEDETSPTLAPLTQTERLAEDAALTGVYMTGSEPGQHGIVILGDGRLKLFVVNAQAAPSLVYGTYRLGRLGTSVCLATDQPGGLIKVLDRETLEFGGGSFKRIP